MEKKGLSNDVDGVYQIIKQHAPTFRPCGETSARLYMAVLKAAGKRTPEPHTWTQFEGFHVAISDDFFPMFFGEIDGKLESLTL
jgi:hypothetical protein